jgi:hypothetical protein
MGSDLLLELMPFRELGSNNSLNPSSFDVGLELPCLSPLFLGPLLYFGIGISSPSSIGVLVRCIFGEFFGSILGGFFGPFYLDRSTPKRTFLSSFITYYNCCDNSLNFTLIIKLLDLG